MYWYYKEKEKSFFFLPSSAFILTFYLILIYFQKWFAPSTIGTFLWFQYILTSSKKLVRELAENCNWEAETAMNGKFWLWRHQGKWGSQYGLHEQHLAEQVQRAPCTHLQFHSTPRSGDKEPCNDSQKWDRMGTLNSDNSKKTAPKSVANWKGAQDVEDVTPGILGSHTMTIDYRCNSALWCLFAGQTPWAPLS